jgi:hypothetical protein
MNHSEQSRAPSRRAVHRWQTPAWIGIDRAFDGDDDRYLMEVQAREFPVAMHVLFRWTRETYRRAEDTVGTRTVLGDLAEAERHPDPRCLRQFYAYVAAVYRRSLPLSTQGELPFDGRDDDVRLRDAWRDWLGELFRRMIDQPAIVNDVLVAQIHPTAAVGRRAGKRVADEVFKRFRRAGETTE